MGVAQLGAVPTGLKTLFQRAPGTAVPGYPMPPCGLVLEGFQQ